MNYFKRGGIIKAKSLFISLILLCVVMLSVSATFAADDNVDAVAIDEIDDGEPLAVDEDSQSLSAGDVVTKDNFNSYFDNYGKLLDNVTATELTFKGEISDVGTNSIILDRPIKISGDNSTFNGVSIVKVPIYCKYSSPTKILYLLLATSNNTVLSPLYKFTPFSNSI